MNIFGRDIYNDKITLKEAFLLVEIMDFKEKQDRKIQIKTKTENILLKTFMHFLRVEKEFLILLKTKHFQLKLKVQVFQTKSLTILISKSQTNHILFVSSKRNY